MAKERVQFDITAWDKTKGAFRSVNAGLTKLKSAAQRMTLAITGIGVAFGYPLKQMANTIDEAGKLSRQLGMSVKDLEAFKLAADLGGSSLDLFAKASKQTSKAVFDFVKRGTGEAKDAFKELGITQGDLIPIMNDNVAVFDLIAEHFSKMDSGATKTAVAMKLFGVRATEMLNVFEGGSGTIKQAREEAERFGLVLKNDQVRAVEHANDEFTRLLSVFKGIGKQLTGQLFPKLGEIATKVRNDILGSIEESFGSVENFAVHATEKIMSTLTTLGKFAKGIGGIIAGIGKVVVPVFNIISKITEKIFLVLEKATNLFRKFHKSQQDRNDPFSRAFEDSGFAPKTTKADGLTTQSGGDAVDEVLASFEDGFRDINQALTMFNDGLDTTKEKGVEAFEKTSEEATEFNEVLIETDEQVNKISVSMERLASASDEAGGIIAKNFEDAIFKAKSFEDAIGAVADQLLRLAFRKTVTDPLSEALSTFIGGVFKPSNAATVPGAQNATANVNPGQVLSAYGNVIRGGSVVPFARGGVVSSPTTFAMAGGKTGKMGEMGAEGILPLKRGANGRLGVEASFSGKPSGSTVNVNVIDQRRSGAEPEVKETRDSQGNRQISVLIKDVVKTGFAEGAFDRQMKAFGVSRGGLGRN